MCSTERPEAKAEKCLASAFAMICFFFKDIFEQLSAGAMDAAKLSIHADLKYL